MKSIMKNHIKLMLSIPLAALVLAGCKDPIEPDPIVVPNYLRLSHNALSFDVSGERVYVVTVESAPAEWEIETQGDWIETSDITASSITITATPNGTATERNGKIIVSNESVTEEILINQLTQPRAGIPKFRLMEDGMEFQISQGGKTGLEMRIDNSARLNYFAVVDLATSERRELGGLANYILGSVSDDGSVVIVNGSSLAGIAKRYVDGSWVDVPPVGGATTSVVTGMSADGSIWVGWCQQRTTYFPTKWVNGVPEQLSVPDLTGQGRTTTMGAWVRGCSADGSVCFGSVATNEREAVYWKPDGTWAFVAEDLFSVQQVTTYDPVFGERMSNTFCGARQEPRDGNQSSPDGKYLAMDYKTVVDNTIVYYPMFANLETGEYTILDDSPLRGFGYTVGNDGTCFYALAGTGQGASEGWVYDPASQTTKSVTEWVREYYGIAITGEFYVSKVTGDGNTVIGTRITTTSAGRPIYAPFYITKEGI